jgi:pimeloyl-ACP methyl ester carboxylesterase
MDRRTLIKGTAAASALAAAPPAAARSRRRSFTFVLVHGAWHGGWCWRYVAEPLRRAGHRVFTPTLTGLGERLHLSSPAVVHDTHVRDIAAVLELEDLSDVILVGHSYGGLIISAVADRIPERIAKRVYLDALLPTPGAPAFPLPPEQEQGLRAAMPGGFRMASPFPPEGFGVPADHPLHPWVARRLTDMPFNVFTTPVVLGPEWDKTPRCYIEAKRNTLDGTKAGAARAKAESWEMFAIDTGHDVMVTEPAALTALLLKIARTAPRRTA